MTLNAAQRDALEAIGDFTEDTFLQPQYASLILRQLRRLSEQGQPIIAYDAMQWAREREWKDVNAGMLAGIVWAVRYGFDPHYGEVLAAPDG